MQLTLKSLEKQLSKGKISPVYFIMGPEWFLIKESLRLIETHTLKKQDKDFNYEVFYAGEAAALKARTAIETSPVFCEKRIVVIHNTHNLKESDWKTLKPIIEKPVKTCILVFVSKQADKRKKTIKQLLALSTVVSALPPKESDWPVWIRWMGQKKGLSFSPQAVEILKQKAGSNLINLNNEIEKLKHFIGDKNPVSAEDVLAVVPRVRPENIFALSTALGQKQKETALLCWQNLLEDDQNELGALALIVRHIRILARVKTALLKGLNAEDTAAQAGVPFFTIRSYIQESSLWTDQKLTLVLHDLYKTDQALKSFSTPGSILIENCIIKACS